MALGGGTFTTTNKVLPGAYINFVSSAKATSTLADNGIVAVPMELDWGVQGKIFEVGNAEFYKNSVDIFGYDYGHEKMKNLRELFLNARLLLCYRLGSGGTQAENDFAKALYPGIRGNDIVITIEDSVDDDGKYVVITKVDQKEWDRQTVASAAELKANNWVTFKSQATLSENSGAPLAGGKNGTTAGNDYQTFLDQAESYTYNILACDTTDDTTKKLFGAYTKRLRDEVGIKFQTVLHSFPEADYYGVISVENTVDDLDVKESVLVYWTAGAEAGCPINRSVANTIYNGEYTVVANYTQRQLEQMLQAGKFVFHKVGNTIRVLDDINTLVTVSETVGNEFAYNQTVRVLDQIGNTVAAVFNNKYSGKFNNDHMSRNALRNDVVKIINELYALGAVEDFDSDDIAVDAGDTKRDVIVSMHIKPSGAMSKLYMTVHVG